MPPRPRSPRSSSRRPIVTLLAILVPIVVVAACSDENRPGTYNGPSQSGNTGVLTEGGTSSGEGGGGDATSEGGAPTCQPRAQLCTPFAFPGATPGPINGGSLVQGIYVLVGSTGNIPCHTLYFADGNAFDVEVTSPATDAGPAISGVRASRFRVAGNGITFEEACPSSGTVNASYGFDGTQLTIEQSGGTRKDVYRKQ